ncbi:MAG: ABC transporter permease [Candidatus Sumerlaeaceae bacterium]|nr:ABC transporter permease [Candidatus Sumerlaeaceae bacterium]
MNPSGMLGRVARLYRSELTKAWRTKLPYVGLVASALMALVARQSVEGLSRPGTITAPSYFAASVNMSTTIIVPIFATIFAAMLVAGETSRGTLRTILVRPVTRREFLTAKLLSGMTYLFLLMLANVVPALVIASGYPAVAYADRGIGLPGPAQQVGIFALALALTLIPQAATVCFGFFISTLAPNVATAIGLAVGLLLSLEPIKQFVRFGAFELETWLFTSYYDTAIGIADSKASGIYEVWGQWKVWMLLGTSLVSSLVFLAVAYRVFARRDLNA